MNVLMDPELIKKNFSEKPNKHHEGISWAVDAAILRGDKKVIKMKSFLESLEKNKTK